MAFFNPISVCCKSSVTAMQGFTARHRQENIPIPASAASMRSLQCNGREHSNFRPMVRIFAKDQTMRLRRVRDAETELLLHYAETIQARGCNSVWESATPEYLVNQTRDFLKFLDDEAMEATVDIQLFYASCLPSHDRRFGITGRGSFCLVPKDTKPDDLVCVPHGNRVPLIFRKINNE